jgi:hypothetical protein
MESGKFNYELLFSLLGVASRYVGTKSKAHALQKNERRGMNSASQETCFYLRRSGTLRRAEAKVIMSYVRSTNNESEASKQHEVNNGEAEQFIIHN